MHISHRSCPGIGLLLCSVLYTQQGGGGAQRSPLVSSPQTQVTAQPTIPMLDEAKGLIHLDISVTKADGEPVSGLHREDFELLNEDRPQKILSFHEFSGQSSGPEPPVQVILFFDTLCRTYPSCMLKADALRAQSGIEAFVEQNNGHLNQPVSIFGISDDGLWTVPHHDSTDGNSLASDLSSGKRIVLNHRPDALRALAFIATSQRRKRGHKVMLWIGPGCSEGTGIFPANHSEGQKTFDSIYWFTTLFREARVSIDELPVDHEGPCAPGYQAYLNGPQTVHDTSDRFLYKKVLAIQSGGRVADDTNDLVAEMTHCLMGALNFYTLSFDPPIAVQPHERHKLQARLDKPGLVVHTNTSYYDEPFYSDQPNPAAQRVTVAQLEQILRKAYGAGENVFGGFERGPAGRSSEDERPKISQIELTERVAFAQLSQWSAEYTNRSLQQALIGVADASAFLDPPPAEIPKQAAPDRAAQERILDLAKDYLDNAVPKLPDFYATRTTVRYEDTPLFNADKITADYQPLHVVEMSKAKVLYRNGKEVVESQGTEPDESSNSYLITHGAFGTLLAEVRQAMETRGRMKWLRWERGPEGSRAVFQFEVPQAESMDFEGGCCLPDAEGQNPFRKQSGYGDEIAIDPLEGTILRLQQKFDMREYVPMDRDEILIDYGPVKIGGKTYFCPVRSVSLARGRSIISLKDWDQSFLSYGPYSTKMNDMRFSNYHVFRAESRILPGFKPDE
jgi:VWFA-related protein